MNSEQQKTKNRRRSIRRQTKPSTKIACHLGKFGLGPNVAHKVLDLSETGVRFRAAKEFAHGQEIEVELLSLSHRRPVKIPAEVVWCVRTAEGDYCIGAQFRKSLCYKDLLQM